VATLGEVVAIDWSGDDQRGSPVRSGGGSKIPNPQPIPSLFQYGKVNGPMDLRQSERRLAALFSGGM